MRNHLEKIKQAIPYCLIETNFQSKKHCGKVRDTYDLNNQLLLITTDRLSGFDRHLANIPFKGQVLNQLSYWWFKKTSAIIKNHVIDMVDPNAMLVKKCKVLPIEIIVRGYITGTTNTALWTLYNKGERQICGNTLPEGLRKNQQLPTPIITPTTKETTHDRPLTPDEIISNGLTSQKTWENVCEIALQLYKFGVGIALKQGLILVDTKYEFGIDEDGNLILIDELHTPDSSRYWLSDTYQERFANHDEPDNLDKELIRLWYKKHCDPYNDKTLPPAPESMIIKVAESYIHVYEMLTGNRFEFPDLSIPFQQRLENNFWRKRS